MRKFLFYLVLLPLIGEAQTPLTNLDFEYGTPGRVPSDWSMFSSPQQAGYQAALVREGCMDGRGCALLTGPSSAPAGSYGTLSKYLSATPYRLRQIRVGGFIRTDGAQSQMWLNAATQGGAALFFGNTPITTSTQWQYFQIDGIVPAEAYSVNFGFLIIGGGQVWVDDASFEITGLVRPSPAEPPRPLNDTGLENLTAFAKLLGYVRHFHPSDEAATVKWDVFAVDGVRAVEDAATPEELATRLRSLFGPIAPTVRIFPTGSAPELPIELSPPSDPGFELIRWYNFGVRLTRDSNIYKSERVTSPVTGGPLPDGFLDPADPFEAEIGRGLSVLVPLDLYRDAAGTLPHTSLQPSQDTYDWKAEDRATRLAAVILAWNAPRHFYPYFDVVTTDWAGALVSALKTAATDAGAADFLRTLQRLVAAQKDGHGWVWQTKGAPTTYVAPLVWDWVENQLVITRVKGAQEFAPGDRVLSIDGKPAEEALAEQQQLVSGATPQWVLWRALINLAYCDSEKRSMELEMEPYASVGSRQTVQLTCGTDYDWSEPRGDIVQELEPGIMYVDLSRLTGDAWSNALPQLASASGVILDMRGYPQTTAFLNNLSRTPLRSPQWHVPVPLKPDQVDMAFAESSWALPPAEPYLAARRVFLTDGRAISAAETVMGIVESYRLAEIVGAPTAGTNGNINYNDLPGGFRVSFTGMKVLKQDGLQHHGVGIHPTVPAERTRRGIAEGRDEVLERGLEVVKWPAPGPAPAINADGVVSAATFIPGPIAPGEMVAVLGRGIGPTELVQSDYGLSEYLPLSVGDTKVFFDGVQARVVDASSTQVTAIVPYGAAGPTTVRVEFQGRSSNEIPVSVAPMAPGIFLGTRNQDGSLNSEATPAARGEIVTLFATGEGRTTPAGVDGKRPATGMWPEPIADLAVTFDGVRGEVQFAGLVSAGMLQVDVKVPEAAPYGSAVPLMLVVGDVESPDGRTIALR